MKLKDFIKEINNKRKIKCWYYFNGIVEDKIIQLKGYKTWLQIYRVDEISFSCSSDVLVKDFHYNLNKPFK